MDGMRGPFEIMQVKHDSIQHNLSSYRPLDKQAVVVNFGPRILPVPRNDGTVLAQSDHGKGFRPGTDLLIPSKDTLLTHFV